MAEELVDLLIPFHMQLTIAAHRKLHEDGWVCYKTTRPISRNAWTQLLWLLGTERTDFRFLTHRGTPRGFGGTFMLSPKALTNYVRYSADPRFRAETDADYCQRIIMTA